MKVMGKTLAVVNQKRLTILRKAATGDEQVIELIISPPQLTFVQKYQPTGVLDFPKAPVELVRDKKTGKVETDENGSIVTLENRKDPDFIRKSNRAANRSEAMQFKDVLRLDPNVEFESQEPPLEKPDGKDGPSEQEWKKSWAKYGDALYDEIEAAGFTEAEIQEVLRTGNQLGISTNDEKAAADFS